MSRVSEKKVGGEKTVKKPHHPMITRFKAREMVKVRARMMGSHYIYDKVKILKETMADYTVNLYCEIVDQSHDALQNIPEEFISNFIQEQADSFVFWTVEDMHSSIYDKCREPAVRMFMPNTNSKLYSQRIMENFIGFCNQGEKEVKDMEEEWRSNLPQKICDSYAYSKAEELNLRLAELLQGLVRNYDSNNSAGVLRCANLFNSYWNDTVQPFLGETGDRRSSKCLESIRETFDRYRDQANEVVSQAQSASFTTGVSCAA